MEIFQGDHAIDVDSNREESIRAVKVADFSSEYVSQPATSFLVRNIEYPPRDDVPQGFLTREYGTWWIKGEGQVYIPLDIVLYNNVKAPSGKVFQSEYGDRGGGGGGRRRKLDFIDIQFECEFIPTKLLIYETINPGSVVGIWALVGEYEQKSWEPIYHCPYQTPTVITASSRILAIPISNFSDFVSVIRIEMEQTDNWFYSELDGVRAFGFKREGGLGEKENDVVREGRGAGVPSSKDDSLLAVPPDPCYMDQLPSELVEKIAGLLNLRDRLQLSATTKRYWSIICHSSLFVSMNLRPFWFSINSRVLNILSANFTAGFRELDLSWCGLYMGHGWLSSLSNFFSTLRYKPVRLTRLRLNNSRCLLSSLRLILESFPLEELSLEQTKIYPSVEEQSLKSDYFRDLVLLFPESLTALNIAGSPMDTCTLVSLAARLRRLQHLNICNCERIDLDVVLPKICPLIPDLRTLQAWRLRITSVGLKGLTVWKSLEEIDLGWSLTECHREGDRGVQAFVEVVKENPNLKVLDLSCFKCLDKTCLDAIAKYCPQLEQIRLMGISSANAQTIWLLLKSCARLRHIDVSFCSIFSSGCRQLAEAFPHCKISAVNIVTHPVSREMRENYSGFK